MSANRLGVTRRALIKSVIMFAAIFGGFALFYGWSFGDESGFTAAEEPHPFTDGVASWVSDEQEVALQCEIFRDCLHLNVSLYSVCKHQVIIDFAVFDENDNWLYADVLTLAPSQVSRPVEVGSHKYLDYMSYGIADISCGARESRTEYV